MARGIAIKDMVGAKDKIPNTKENQWNDDSSKATPFFKKIPELERESGTWGGTVSRP